MRVCEQLTKRFKGEYISSFLEYYEIQEFEAGGTVLMYDLLTDNYTRKPIKDIINFEIVERL